VTITDLLYLAGAIITAVGGASGLIVGLSGWLSKVWAARILERERATYAVELEKWKAELARLSHEHQVRYTRLYEERARVIAQLYAHLAEFHDAVRALSILSLSTSDGGVAAALPHAQESASKRYASLRRLFRRTRIWLDPQTGDQVETILRSLSKVESELKFHLEGWRTLDANQLAVISAQLQIEVPKAQAMLDQRFRSMLEAGAAALEPHDVLPE
jgi:hypothetical protein